MTPAWYNTRKAAQVAAYFAKAEGGRINVLKLTKLIYLADRAALTAFDAPILCDNFVSMDHGPVNSITLNQLNGMSDDREDWDKFIGARVGHNIPLSNPDLKVHDLDELSEAEIQVLEITWQRFGGMDRYALRDYTHKNCPEWEDPKGSSEPIPVERILKHLGKLDGAAIAAKLESERITDELFDRANELPPGEEGDSAYALRATG